MALLHKILSGGQSGADRAALDFAIEQGIPHGGWCPKGRMAEDGPINTRYHLQETPKRSYRQRTEWNVQDGDGTVVVSIAAQLTGGSKQTVFLAHKHGKPVLSISRDGGPPSPGLLLRRFIQENHIKVLNVAGPRASEEPDVGTFVARTLKAALLDSGGGETTRTGQPTLRTARLILRPWRTEDAAALQRLAGSREIADTMISVPHPFTRDYAEKWIAGHAEAQAKGTAVHFAITLATTDTLVGAIELRGIDPDHSHAELSLWVGMPWWGQGLATEAARAVLRHAFEQLHLNRVVAHHMVRNPASGRALEKVGMKCEGLLRQDVKKWGRFEDVVVRGILRADWMRGCKNSGPGAADEPT